MLIGYVIYGKLFTLFCRLFKKYPVTQSLFRAFKDVDPETLYENKQIAAHGSTVMAAISSVVDNLDDSDTLCEILKTTGRNHKNRGIKKEYFEVSLIISKMFTETHMYKCMDRICLSWKEKINSITLKYIVLFAS